MNIRLQKFLADCGVASRRKSEMLIAGGNIRVNGEVIRTLGTTIDPIRDIVEYKGKRIQPQQHIYLMAYKPRGYTSTTRSFRGEKNILDFVQRTEKLFPVGRLDKDSEGLIILTNDGDWAQRITHPKYQIEKEYELVTVQELSRTDLERMKQGITDDGEFLKIQKYKILGPTSAAVILTQGHKRELRRLCRYMHKQVRSLKRVRIGKWKLGLLKPGETKEFRPT